jgi:hypothetical protein
MCTMGQPGRPRNLLEVRPNHPPQPTAAAMLVWLSSLSLGAADAAEVGWSASRD